MVKYVPQAGVSIQDTCEILVQLANKSAKPARASFNDTEVTANPGDDPAALVRKYYEDRDRRVQEIQDSPEYKLEETEREERKRRQQVKDGALAEALANAPKMITFKTEVDPADKKAWKDLLDLDPKISEQGRIIRCIDRWARLMEARIAKGETIDACARETHNIADNEGLNIFGYSYAASMLSHIWTHGEQLQQWWNKNAQPTT